MPKQGASKAPNFCLPIKNQASGFGDLASFDCLDADPHAFHLPAGQADPHSLHIGLESTLDHLGHMHADPASFLGLALAVDTTPPMGAFTCDCAYSGH